MNRFAVDGLLDAARAGKAVLVVETWARRAIAVRGPAATRRSGWTLMATRCGSPGCTQVVTPRVIQTTVPDTKPVTLTWCRECDTRTCGLELGGTKCDSRILDPFVKKCARGHRL